MLGELGPVPEGDGREEVVRDVVVRDLQFVSRRGSGELDPIRRKRR